jgi:putative PIN family toxin of toxin-antitoxin system
VRVVADTNVLVSALVFPGGSPEEVYRLVLEGRIELVTSRPLLAELGRVLVATFGWAPGQAREAIEQVVRRAEVVTPGEPVSEIAADPADNRVVEAAAAGAADAIVSGDSHLLELDSWQGIPIRPPAAFLASLEET